MLKGKINSALRLLEEAEYGGILPLTTETLEELQLKHPKASPSNESVLVKGELPFVDPAMFNNIDESSITKAALKTKGSAGPSGLDSDGRRRILVSKNFGNCSKDLRSTLANMARKLCIEEVTLREGESQSSIECYIACCLVPLDKDGDGVRPIGIGEVLRRIIGKSIISVLRPDLLESAGSLQLCAGHQAGCESAVHAMSSLLLVDASNAFNALNRSVLQHNIQYICPPISTNIRNCYSTSSRLFITGGGEIEAVEGTTQGDPLASLFMEWE